MALSGKKKRIGELLVESGIMTREDFEKILLEQKDSSKRIGELIVERGICSEYDIAAALSSQLGMPCIDLKTAAIEPAGIEIAEQVLVVQRRRLVLRKGVFGRGGGLPAVLLGSRGRVHGD